MMRDEYWSWRFGDLDKWKLKSLGAVTSIFESEDIALSEYKVLLGRCEAEPKTVARLAGVSETIATEAVSNPSKPVFLGEVCQGTLPSIVFGCYLLVYQA